jgi:hypothetical protein
MDIQRIQEIKTKIESLRSEPVLPFSSFLILGDVLTKIQFTEHLLNYPEDSICYIKEKGCLL